MKGKLANGVGSQYSADFVLNVALQTPKHFSSNSQFRAVKGHEEQR